MRFVFAMSLFLSLVLVAVAADVDAADKSAVPSSAPVANAVEAESVSDRLVPDGGLTVKTPPSAQNTPDGLHVNVKGDRLSVNVKDQTFGEVISVIANIVGFDVKLSNDVFNKGLSTRFQNVELERGILRLLSLMGQKNYYINYKPDGSIKELEVYGDISSGERTISGRGPSPTPDAMTKPKKSRPTRSTAPPPAPPARVIRDRAKEKQSSDKTTTQAPEGPAEPMAEEEVLELEYKLFINEESSESEEETGSAGGVSSSPAVTAPSNTSNIDYDGDGYSLNQGDCNDTASSIYPGAVEICGDGIDQDCSGADSACPVGSSDTDDDGDGYTENQGDCNDAASSLYPGAVEICGDGIDQDCSGADSACIEEEITPEGDIPASGELLNAPYCPPQPNGTPCP